MEGKGQGLEETHTPEEGVGATLPAECGAQGLSDRVIPDKPFIRFLREKCEAERGWREGLLGKENYIFI